MQYNFFGKRNSNERMSMIVFIMVGDFAQINKIIYQDINKLSCKRKGENTFGLYWIHKISLVNIRFMYHERGKTHKMVHVMEN